MSKIAVIRAGFYGSYIALKLADKGHKVILIDSEPIKTSEVKALFGITENSLSQVCPTRLNPLEFLQLKRVKFSTV